MKKRLLPLLLAALAALAATFPQHAWARNGYGPPPGRILVTNHSGGTVTFTVAGHAGRTLAPWQTTDVYASPGENTVRATYVQFGVERTLMSDRIFVVPGRSIPVTLAPENTGRVLVRNDGPVAAQLFVDGRPGAKFTPFESRVVSLSVGRHALLLAADGRMLGSRDLTLRAFEEPQWTVSAPRTGELLVQNPLPIPVQLVCDKGLVRSVAAYGQTTYAGLPVGTFRLTARRLTGELVDGASSEIRAGGLTHWRVDPPSTGFVSLDSDHFLGVEVRLDGKRMANLAPNAPTQIEAKVGWHELVVTDERGRVVLTSWIEVEPYSVERVSFGYRGHTQAEGYGRTDRDSRSDRGTRSGRGHEDHDGHDHGTVVASGESCGMP